ncbi:low temperature requirement protein A [Streptomyces atratus]|uniref:low temperature requirement protein A n=1 Tax=Streptomyces atratus TaxID=1893 RepID=UPI0034102C6E
MEGDGVSQGQGAKRKRGLRVEHVVEQSAATNLELFFDLVFVFALTQITKLISSDLTGTGVLHGFLVLAIVWWCWVDYSWLANVVKADEGVTRAAMLAAMAAMFIIALVIPEAFTDLPGGLSGPTVVACAYLVLRAVHVAQFVVASRGDPHLRRQVLLFAGTMAGSTALLLAAGSMDGATQTVLWCVAVVVDYGGTLAIGNQGWRVNSAKHFAERHGLIVIIGLGESIVAVGAGVAHLPISWPIILAAVLGLSLSASLWWAYFDTTALRAEHALTQARDHHRSAMAQTAYTYLHLPIVGGIALVALGMEYVLEYVGGHAHHSLSDPLKGIPLAALLGGTALYLLAVAAFEKRTYGEFKKVRAVLAAALLALYPAVSLLPAIGALAIVTVLLAGLNLYETLHHRPLRHSVRHGHHA